MSSPALSLHEPDWFYDVQAKGDAAFKTGDFEVAIEHYSEAIELNTSNHVLFSNRSACHVRKSAVTKLARCKRLSKLLRSTRSTELKLNAFSKL